MDTNHCSCFNAILFLEDVSAQLVEVFTQIKAFSCLPEGETHISKHSLFSSQQHP